jgi:predicted nuclease with TOPRIM domain
MEDNVWPIFVLEANLKEEIAIDKTIEDLTDVYGVNNTSILGLSIFNSQKSLDDWKLKQEKILNLADKISASEKNNDDIIEIVEMKNELIEKFHEANSLADNIISKAKQIKEESKKLDTEINSLYGEYLSKRTNFDKLYSMVELNETKDLEDFSDIDDINNEIVRLGIIFDKNNDDITQIVEMKKALVDKLHEANRLADDIISKAKQIKEESKKLDTEINSLYGKYLSKRTNLDKLYSMVELNEAEDLEDFSVINNEIVKLGIIVDKNNNDENYIITDETIAQKKALVEKFHEGITKVDAVNDNAIKEINKNFSKLQKILIAIIEFFLGKTECLLNSSEKNAKASDKPRDELTNSEKAVRWILAK